MDNTVPTVSAGSSSGGVFTPDSSSPLFIHSSDIPGTSLVHVPFSGSGYGGWKRSMIVSLSAKNKIAFVDGSCPKPSDDSPELRQWNRCNNMVISWLTSSLSPEIAESVQYSETAESIWTQLENRYGGVNGTKVFELKRELSNTNQGSMNMASYFNKLKKLWDELGAIRKNSKNKCSCAAKDGITKEEEEDRLYQFLMGLNETYVTVRSNFLMMQPLPSLDTAYSILLQDESQRQLHIPSQLNTETASFNANLNNRSYYPNNNSRPSNSYTDNRPPGQGQYNQKVNFDQNKGEIYCRYCRKSGHLIKQCPKLSGSNNNKSNQRFQKGKITAANATSESDFSFGSSDPVNNQQASLVPGLTNQQYSQLISLLQQSHLSESEPQINILASANFAGILLSYPEMGGECMDIDVFL